ncbi:MAG: DUF2680 domain-containing protein [Clostridia bacterium]|uniref:DUF2680 domain-containing protein n=1 Tax=Desulforamulus aeronauticus DSM 10349 TaxID=1121421 RepID=A0A1M6X7I9_9FIRM|nr:DUF2680 domain-containing protein [Desulforamulus aeronauticus]MDA8210555.1 DUF2680 domain-containing protein [Clostridia bacterium]SHL01883.1 Protein of unknown function [Desulforamulus aeronauticus DSM 10349]
MKKAKFLVLGLVALAMMAMVVPGAFAASTDVQKNANQDYYNQMFEWRLSQVDQALKNGYISEEQANAMKQQINSMKDYAQKNGFGPMMGNGYYGMGHHGMMGNGFSGMGPGMMGGGFYGSCW